MGGTLEQRRRQTGEGVTLYQRQPEWKSSHYIHGIGEEFSTKVLVAEQPSHKSLHRSLAHAHGTHPKSAPTTCAGGAGRTMRDYEQKSRRSGSNAQLVKPYF